MKVLQYWKSEGRVHLELACPVWHSSLTVAQSRSLERVQRVAMAAITSWGTSYTQQLLDMGLERLSVRRQILCLRFARKTATNSRHTDLFTPVVRAYTTRNTVPTYREPLTRTSSYYKSSLPYLTRLLNSNP